MSRIYKPSKQECKKIWRSLINLNNNNRYSANFDTVDNDKLPHGCQYYTDLNNPEMNRILWNKNQTDDDNVDTNSNEYLSETISYRICNKIN